MKDNFGDKRNTAGFNVNPDNINKSGRPRKIYTILKEMNYSSEDIKTAFSELAWYTLSELEEIQQDKNIPVLPRIIAKQFILALEKGDWAKVREIMEHVIGKPNQSIISDTTISDKRKEVGDLFPEELDNLKDDQLDELITGIKELSK
jgi:uncharacterized protein (UPF0147 family)